MSSRADVVIHQTAPSIKSSYSATSAGSYAPSSSSYSPRTMSPTEEQHLRYYGAAKHTIKVKNNREVTVVNRQQAGYEYGAPTPDYGKVYGKR
ncbi:hypothetical protein Cob_v009182 [Colletotrichum orbiculare MAFF 240422]|uniref:Uncharacterized protein n=1 Tax=Colletotrichum orbiculare (strain 104-T / ATCC 96160 / CBS 514.97 / LARS 414 / MAFF 240422) TaxID=1213857 RepID=A0A484FIN5_COLOR|nr:hypothetical protein Cob_v009182 [Colletotrichum orbiculare MAFF 240422]